MGAGQVTAPRGLPHRCRVAPGSPGALLAFPALRSPSSLSSRPSQYLSDAPVAARSDKNEKSDLPAAGRRVRIDTSDVLDAARGAWLQQHAGGKVQQNHHISWGLYHPHRRAGSSGGSLSNTHTKFGNFGASSHLL